MFEVRGGVYTDMSFKFITPGTEERYGPFKTREEAEKVWRGKMGYQIDTCEHRLFVVEVDEGCKFKPFPLVDATPAIEAFRSVREQVEAIQQRLGELGCISDEARAQHFLDAELGAANMDNMSLYGVTGAFWQRRDAAAIRAIVAAMREARAWVVVAQEEVQAA